MKIAVDLRPLENEKISGVKIYLVELLRGLAEIDTKNEYFLWWNSRKSGPPRDLPHTKNFHVIHTSFSNRLLNLSFTRRKKFADKIILDALAKKKRPRKKIDLFWLPDPRPLALSANCKLAATIHDLSPTLFPQFFSKKTRIWHRFLSPKKIANSADGVLAVSKSTATDIAKIWGVAKNKIFVCPPALENFSKISAVEKGRVRKKYELPKNFVLALGTLEPRKNLPTLVDAFEKLKSKTDLPHALVVAGEPDPAIFASVKLRKKNWLQPIGRVDPRDKPALFSLANVFCFPSIYEGFGLPVAESLAVGTPIIASDIPTSREVAGNSAIFVKTKNVEAWSLALAKILLEKQIPPSGRRQAAAFSGEKSAKKLLAAFEKIS